MFDQNLIFSDAQSVAQTAGNYLSDKSLDASPTAGTPSLGGPLVSDFGRGGGRDLDIVVYFTTAVTSGGAATVQFQLVQADDAALGTNLEVLRESRVLGYAAFVKGAIVSLGRVPSMSRRYFGLRYVIGTATTTAGVVTAGLRKGVPTNSFNLVA